MRKDVWDIVQDIIIAVKNWKVKHSNHVMTEEEKERLRQAGIETESKFELTEEQERELEELEKTKIWLEKEFGKEEQTVGYVIPKMPTLQDKIKEIMEEEDEPRYSSEDLDLDELTPEAAEDEEKNPFEIFFDEDYEI